MPDEITALLSQVGITNETFIVLVILAVVVVGAIIVIIASRPILDIYPYLHPNARVRARKGRLFDEKQLSEIVESSNTEEIIAYLRGFPDYAEYLDNYSLDKALDIQLAETYDLVSRIVPKDIQKSFNVLSKKTDINNIKSLLAAKEVGLSSEDTLELLVPAGSLYDDIERLSTVNSVNEVITGLDGTEYSSVLEDAIPSYEDKQMLLPLESALDKYYLNNLIKSTEVPANENTEILYSFIGTQVDIVNLKLIIRAKADNLDFDTISPYMIESGYKLRDWKLKDLMESQGVSGAISSLEGTKYAEILADPLNQYNDNGDVSTFEKALDTYAAEYYNSLATKKPLGIGPIIGFLSKKETEIRNLKIIARAKREIDFPIEKIQEILV